jgi:hypothetical protein
MTQDGESPSLLELQQRVKRLLLDLSSWSLVDLGKDLLSVELKVELSASPLLPASSIRRFY